jgi:hypothetical protein
MRKHVDGGLLVSLSSPHAAIVLDPEGKDLHAEGALLRQYAPAARLLMPGGVMAWGIAEYATLRRVLLPSFLDNGHVGLPVNLYPSRC